MTSRTEASPDKAPDPGEPEITPGYANYVLGVLFVVYVFNFIDRQILNILLEPIKKDLGVSDTAMGFLTGIAFAAFYSIAGIPIARLADRWVRRSVIAIGLTLWSLFTTLSGLPSQFWQMALARIGVGVGEAAGSPPSHSLIADYFPPERRATALAIYASGIHFGVLFGFLIGGWINEFFGWRWAFFVVGAPGILLAIVLRLTVREPPRGYSEATASNAGAAAAIEKMPSVKEVFAFLWEMPSFRHLSIAAALTAFSGYGMSTWGPAFLIRVHGMGTGEVGSWLGPLTGVFGALGAFVGGYLSDRRGAADERWYLWLPALASLIGLPFALLFLLSPDPVFGLLAGFAPSAIMGAMWLGPTFSMVQTLSKLRMRAVASAILLFIINMIGMGLGPQAVGVMNDTVFASYGTGAVRYSLITVLIVMHVWAAVHFFLGARTLREDLLARDL
ncbi:MAG: MFS transporter [bacterium]|nr:MFS transporter [bacterium]